MVAIIPAVLAILAILVFIAALFKGKSSKMMLLVGVAFLLLFIEHLLPLVGIPLGGIAGILSIVGYVLELLGLLVK